MKFTNPTPDLQKFDTWDLSNGEMYLHFRDCRDNDPKTWCKHLTKLVKSRTVPENATYSNGYYTGSEQYTDHTMDYTINDHGCRSKSFDYIKHKPIIVGIGCSITYGTGLTPEEIWIHKLAEQLNCEYVNLSMPGSALTVSPMYLNDVVIPALKNIRAVFVYTPPPNRVDLITYTDLNEAQYSLNNQDVVVKSLINVIESDKLTKTDKQLLKAIEHTAFVQTEKDLLLLELVCDKHNIGFETLDSELFWRSEAVELNKHTYTKARDGEHDGAELHTDIANEFFYNYRLRSIMG